MMVVINTTCTLQPGHSAAVVEHGRMTPRSKWQSQGTSAYAPLEGHKPKTGQLGKNDMSTPTDAAHCRYVGMDFTKSFF